ncbi:MAG: beta-lactamase [Chitinophagaceae bacterium]|nr:beta-lactamase [Chitinophagaceae bacterium]
MKKKVLLAIVAVFAITHLVLVFTHKTFIYKALIYTYPDINDQDIFYSRTIAPSPTPQPWAISTHYNEKVLPDSLDHLLQQYETTALLIVKNDSILQEHYYDHYSDTTHSGSFSVAKSFVGTLIGIALDKGYIKSLDEPIAHYLPSFQKDGKEKITIRHCLTMSSGLNWDEAYASAFSITTEAYYGTDLEGTVDRLKVSEAPGKFFDYKSGDTQILSLLLTKATGKSTSQFMQENLWGPIGAESYALWSLDDKNHNEKAYCCIYATTRDFARLGKLYLQEGKWGAQQVVSSAYIKEAITPNGLLDKETNKPNDFYGLQWWIYPNKYNKQVFYARGILGQYIIVIPEQQLVIVRLGHKRGEKIGKHPREFIELVNQACEGTF